MKNQTYYYSGRVITYESKNEIKVIKDNREPLILLVGDMVHRATETRYIVTYSNSRRIWICDFTAPEVFITRIYSLGTGLVARGMTMPPS